MINPTMFNFKNMNPCFGFVEKVHGNQFLPVICLETMRFRREHLAWVSRYFQLLFASRGRCKRVGVCVVVVIDVLVVWCFHVVSFLFVARCIFPLYSIRTKYCSDEDGVSSYWGE